MEEETDSDVIVIVEWCWNVKKCPHFIEQLWVIAFLTCRKADVAVGVVPCMIVPAPLCSRPC
jgi:hypothetical protein